MKIVFLDSLSLGGQDLSRFKKFGEFIEYKTTSPLELADRIMDAEILITNKVIMGEKEFSYYKLYPVEKFLLPIKIRIDKIKYDRKNSI